MSNDNESSPPPHQNVVFLQSVKNEKKRNQEPTRKSGNKKKPPMDKTDERFWKLLEIIEEQQNRIQNLEKNFVALVRVMKKITDQVGVPAASSPPQDDA